MTRVDGADRVRPGRRIRDLARRPATGQSRPGAGRDRRAAVLEVDRSAVWSRSDGRRIRHLLVGIARIRRRLHARRRCSRDDTGRRLVRVGAETSAVRRDHLVVVRRAKQSRRVVIGRRSGRGDRDRAFAARRRTTENLIRRGRCARRGRPTERHLAGQTGSRKRRWTGSVRPASEPGCEVVALRRGVPIAACDHIPERDRRCFVDRLRAHRTSEDSRLAGPEHRRLARSAHRPPAGRSLVGRTVVDGDTGARIGVDRDVRGRALPATTGRAVPGETRLGAVRGLIGTATAAAAAPRRLRFQGSAGREREARPADADHVRGRGGVVDFRADVPGGREVADPGGREIGVE